MEKLHLLFSLPLCFSILYILFSFFLLVRFQKTDSASAGQPDQNITLLCPMKGTDENTKKNLENFCAQTTLPREIRFGFDEESDPAVPIVEELAKKHPEIKIRLFFGTNLQSPNRKIANLMKLSDNLSTPFLAVVDQDILMPPAHLEKILLPFASPEIGLVTSLYRIGPPETPGSALELLAIHADFFPNILFAEWMEKGLGFAFGATLACRASLLEKLGGFQRFENYLADDYELGAAVRENGYRIFLSSSIVEHNPGKLSVAEYWKRGIRSARTHRVCRPLGYFLSLFTQGVPWIAADFLSGRLTGLPSTLAGIWVVGRFSYALCSHGFLTKKRGPWWPLLLLPLHELLRFLFWLLAFTGNQVSWRETSYRISSDRTMKILRKNSKD